MWLARKNALISRRNCWGVTLFSRTFCYVVTLFSRTFCCVVTLFSRTFCCVVTLFSRTFCEKVWQSISGQLSKENKKFIYGLIKEGSRAKNFELSIEWLRDAGLLYKVNRTKKGQLPLAAYEDLAAFKVFMLDVGLLGCMCVLSPQTLIEGNAIFTDYKGALTEHYVFQQLCLSPENKIYYWSADNSRGEIDFLVQRGDKIIPIEVKAEENLQSKSLRHFVEANEGLHGTRYSMAPYREQSWMTNYPLYALEATMPWTEKR